MLDNFTLPAGRSVILIDRQMCDGVSRIIFSY